MVVGNIGTEMRITVCLSWDHTLAWDGWCDEDCVHPRYIANAHDSTLTEPILPFSHHHMNMRGIRVINNQIRSTMTNIILSSTSTTGPANQQAHRTPPTEY